MKKNRRDRISAELLRDMTNVNSFVNSLFQLQIRMLLYVRTYITNMVGSFFLSLSLYNMSGRCILNTFINTTYVVYYCIGSVGIYVHR